MNDVWDGEYCTFISWDEAQGKINLTHMDVEDMITFTTTILDQWQHLLEDDLEVTHLDQWVGPHVDEVQDLNFVGKLCPFVHVPTSSLHLSSC